MVKTVGNGGVGRTDGCDKTGEIGARDTSTGGGLNSFSKADKGLRKAAATVGSEGIGC